MLGFVIHRFIDRVGQNKCHNKGSGGEIVLVFIAAQDHLRLERLLELWQAHGGLRGALLQLALPSSGIELIDVALPVASNRLDNASIAVGVETNVLQSIIVDVGFERSDLVF